MSKWIVLSLVIYSLIGYFIALNSSYKPISSQIDVKTMGYTNPSFLYDEFNTCEGTCKNYSSSSSSSSWGSGSGGK